MFENAICKKKFFKKIYKGYLKRKSTRLGNMRKGYSHLPSPGLVVIATG